MAALQHFQAAVDGNTTTAVKLWSDLVDDLTALRTALTAVTAKLDADVVTGLDDDYAATCDPPALKTKLNG